MSSGSRIACEKCLDYFVNTDPNKIPWPEIIFYIINVLYLMIASYYILVAYIEVAWQTSMEALQPGLTMTGDAIELQAVSVTHHIIALFLIVLILIGTYAAYSGSENMLYAYCALMLMTIIFELYVAFRISVRSEDCIVYIEKLSKALKKHARNYYYTEPYKNFMEKSLDPVTLEFSSKPLERSVYYSRMLLGSIQKSLGCCGPESYHDYLDPLQSPGVPDPIDSSQKTYKIPFSCCTAKYGLNIHCASGLRNDSMKALSEQVFTKGCTVRILDLCNEILHSTSRGAVFICFMHFLLFLISIPLVIIQVKILHFLASDVPFTFKDKNFNSMILAHEHPLNAHNYEDLSCSYQKKFHRDSDIILSDETREFVNELKREHGFETDEDIPNNVLVAERVGNTGDQGSRSSLPAFAMTWEDKRKFKKYEGRFNYFLNKQLLNYAAAVLNSDPSNDARKLHDMKKAELLAKMSTFYKDVLKDQKTKLVK